MKISSVLIACLFFFSLPMTVQAASNEKIKKDIIAESIASYPGKCPCPYNTDKRGRSCGGRSAYSRAGGYSVLCYPKDVSDEEIKRYKANK